MLFFYLIPLVLLIIVGTENKEIYVFAFSVIYGLSSIFGNGALVYSSYQKKKVNYKKSINFMKKNYWNYLGFIILFMLSLMGLFILLVIPGIIFSVYWCLSAYIYLGEGLGFKESLRESKRVIKNNWWKVFGYSLLLGLIYVLFAVVMELLIPVLSNLILVFLTTPFFILFYKNLYFELKAKASKKKKNSKN